MTFWRRLREQLRGPIRVDSSMDGSIEVDDDLAEEFPVASADARETADSEAARTRGGVNVASPLAPPPPETLALENAQAEANQDS